MPSLSFDRTEEPSPLRTLIIQHQELHSQPPQRDSRALHQWRGSHCNLKQTLQDYLSEGSPTIKHLKWECEIRTDTETQVPTTFILLEWVLTMLESLHCSLRPKEFTETKWWQLWLLKLSLTFFLCEAERVCDHYCTNIQVIINSSGTVGGWIQKRRSWVLQHRVDNYLVCWPGYKLKLNQVNILIRNILNFI